MAIYIIFEEVNLWDGLTRNYQPTISFVLRSIIDQNGITLYLSGDGWLEKSKTILS